MANPKKQPLTLLQLLMIASSGYPDGLEKFWDEEIGPDYEPDDINDIGAPTPEESVTQMFQWLSEKGVPIGNNT